MCYLDDDNGKGEVEEFGLLGGTAVPGLGGEDACGTETVEVGEKVFGGMLKECCFMVSRPFCMVLLIWSATKSRRMVAFRTMTS